MAVETENPWRGAIANDTKWSRQLAWSRQHKHSLADPATDLQVLASRVARRVSLVRSTEEGRRLAEWKGDLLVVHASPTVQGTQALVRELDAGLPGDIRMAVVEQTGLLDTFGVVADSRVWTARLLRRETVVPDNSVARYSYVPTEKVWRRTPLEPQEVVRHYSLPMDVTEVVEGVKKARAGGAEPWVESAGDMIRFCDVLDAKKLGQTKTRKGPTVIKFYRPNCVSCERLAPVFERFAEEVYKVEAYLEAHPEGLDAKIDNPVTKYNLKNAQSFRQLQVAAASSMVDCEEFSVTKTPTVVVVKGGQAKEVDLVSERFDVDDADRFVYRMMRLVDLMLAD